MFFLLKIITLSVIGSIFIIGVTAITNGRLARKPKRFMVYLLKSPLNKPASNFSAWTCAGAIIHPLYILTSASCVYDVPLIYVIAGYNKYINADMMESDDCIKRTRKRIVYSCVSKKFTTDYKYTHADYWNWGDVAAARVDTAFDYADPKYRQYCSYSPGPIRVNVLQTFARQARHVLTFGWGHLKYYRPKGSFFDLNEKFLRYSSAVLAKPKDCFEKYYASKYPAFGVHFKKFLLCTTQPSKMDEDGHIPFNDDPPADGCGRRSMNSTIESKDLLSNDTEPCASRRQLPINVLLTIGGFCQNDHGAPLVTYIGGHPTLIGVASMFLVTSKMECQGPYAYTNTRCIGRIIHCILYPNRFRRSLGCDGTPEERQIKESHITWPED